jgi:iron only hydrogenase large subunit-like protein
MCDFIAKGLPKSEKMLVWIHGQLILGEPAPPPQIKFLGHDIMLYVHFLLFRFIKVHFHSAAGSGIDDIMPVFISNVDDYLGPSQACVNPLFAPPSKLQSADAKNDSGTATSTNGTKATMQISHASQQHAVQSRPSRRQRLAPRIIQNEDYELSSTPKSREPVRLENSKDSNQQFPAVNANVTTQTITKKAKATVTLSDCLSCTGCVTSAEAVLMSHHSIDTLREASHSQNQRIVFTISPASLADLYRHLYLEDENEINANANDLSISDAVGLEGTIDKKYPPSRHEVLTKIAAFLHSEFGAEMVIDGILSQRISLVESASEFCFRFRKTHRSLGGNKSSGNADPDSSYRGRSVPIIPSVALSSTKTRYINKQPDIHGVIDDGTLMDITTIIHPPGRLVEEDRSNESILVRKTNSHSIDSKFLPMLASSCPGFVCLVEKTAPLVVPLLSSAKSPMSVAGTLVKTGHSDINPRLVTSNSGRKSCYHVAIMPCHDKKLEAGRGDLAWEQQALLQYGNCLKTESGFAAALSNPSTVANGIEEDLVKEVDLVLTTGELLEALTYAASKLMNRQNPTLTAPLTIASEAGCASTVSAIRNLLASTNVTHDSFLLKTVNNSNTHNKNEAMDSLEVDTGVHGSGSYADFIFRYAARELFGSELPPNKPLPWKTSSSTYAPASTADKTTGMIRRRIRRQESKDLQEVALYEHSDGSYSCCDGASEERECASTPVLRFATAYGFKNVQLILQSLSKTESSKSSNGYDYVEIMACPSGCSNGGGQIGANGHRETPRETKQRVRKTVSVVPLVRPLNIGIPLSVILCGCDTEGLVNDEFLGSECFGDSARQLFHTRFHVVPKLELSTGATAGVALSDTKW